MIVNLIYNTYANVKEKTNLEDFRDFGRNNVSFGCADSVFVWWIGLYFFY